MNFFQLLSTLIVLTALFSYVNHRYIKLPPTIGIMLLALGVSLALVALGHWFAGVHAWATALVGQIDFHAIVFHGMLAFLLFAGSLHLDLGELARERVPIALLAIFGTLLSTFLVGLGAWGLFTVLGLGVPVIQCLLFGALISPTDPIAVLSIMQKIAAPKSLEIQMAGESLFNDGVGVVVFITLLEMAGGDHVPGPGDVAWLLIKEAGGGAVLGLILGFVTYMLLRGVDEYQVEIMLTVALAMGGYALAEVVHVSAPIAAVVAGLFIGNQGRALGMSLNTRGHVDAFWKLVDAVLNALLFLLIGLEVLIIPFDLRYLLAGVAAIPVTLLARWLSVVSLLEPLKLRRRFVPGTVLILTWGGLRGGISVALALSFPDGPYRNLVIVATYVIVIFSIACQGLTIGPLIKRYGGGSVVKAAPATH